MDISNKVKEFWNNAYGVNSPITINKDLCVPENVFENYVAFYAKNHFSILDYGCGITFNLFLCYYQNNKINQALGIDPSKNAIDFLNGSVKMSPVKNLNFIKGDIKELKNVKSESIDFLICANVLDCVTEEVRIPTANELARVLAKEGRFLFKVNFFLNQTEAKKHKLEPIGNHEYSQDGIFRIAFYDDEYWINLFSERGLTLLKQDYFQRNPTGPKDRIFIFTKK